MRSLRLIWCQRWREIVGVGLVCAAGLISLDPLRSKSLDCLFAFRGPISTNGTQFPRNVAVVFIEDSRPGDWKPYADLLTALSNTNSPEAVVFDLVFTNNAWNQEIQEFSNAVKNAATRTKVLFATESTTNWQGEIAVRTIKPLLQGLSNLVSSVSNTVVGLADLPQDSDGVVRSYYGSAEARYKPLAWVVAEARKETVAGFFVNYYGPPGTLAHYDATSIVSADHQSNSFEGKVVFVGDNTVDRHQTPYARQPAIMSSGSEIHATAYLNIRHVTGIRGLGGFGEGFLVLLLGIGCGWYFAKWTPRRACMMSVGSATVVVVLSFFLFRNAYCYVPWLSIAAVMMPVAFAVSFLPAQSAFVSYRSTDKETAFRIAEELEKLGVEVYLDLKQKGQIGSLEAGLFPEIEKRGCFLLVVTPALLTLATPLHEQGTPDWVGEEIARALSRGKSILLVYVDDAAGRIAAQKEKIGSLPTYEAIHTKGYRFTIESVLSGKFRSPYSLAHLASSIPQIRQKLPWGIRRDWGKRPSIAYDEQCNNA